MKTPALVLFIALMASSIKCQQISSYDMSVGIDVSHKTIQVNGTMDVDFRHKDTLSLVLWKNSVIHSISLDDVLLSYKFDTTSQSPIMYIPNGRRLLIVKSNKSGDSRKISFDYECDMKNLRGWAGSFSADWIELNFYDAWFPVCANGGNAASNIEISIDSAYLVSGSGIVEKKNGRWKMVQSWRSFDNVIIASPNLKKKVLRTGGACIETDYSDFPETSADSVIYECRYALALYERLYGAKDSTYLKFVIAPVENGGYSRKNFVSLGTKQFNLSTQEGVAHELAHFWWSGANTTTWEDWLNEAFAEYSKLVYLRERLGANFFLSRIDEYKKETLDTPPIWGINRNASDAYVVLYKKGALILYEFEQKVVRDRFFGFLKEISDQKIHATDELLGLVERKFSKETRAWLENRLKTI